MTKTRYKELVDLCKEKNIPYHDTVNGKTIWKTKQELEIALGNVSSAPVVSKSDTPIESAILSLIKGASGISSDIEQRLLALENQEPKASVMTIEVKTPTETKKISGLVHEQYTHVLRLAGLRQNIMLVGPSGTGKTHLAGQVAEGLGLSFAFVSASAGMSESVLEGWLLPGKDGEFSYRNSPFVTAYENGGVFLLDEIDSADGNLMTVINSALANGHMSLPKRLANPIANRHADFVCIVAANTFGHGPNRVYAGRQQLDGATLDRFKAGTVMLDYDATLETALILPDILAWGRAVRERINKHGLRRIMSTRFMRDYSKLVTAYPETYTLDTCKATYLQDWNQDDKNKLEELI